MHKTLELRPNLLMAIGWAVVLAVCLYQDAGTAAGLVAALLLAGLAVGALQSLALFDSKSGFLEASNTLQIRAAMKRSAPGRLAIYLQWMCGLSMVGILFIANVSFSLLTVLACFAAFGFTRELASLPGILALRRRGRSPSP